MQALHTKKLEQALRSHERFPINLEWMVDVFKYKHISSLTTHLKRHFKMNVHYKRFAQEQNKRVWTYFISVDCFIGICEYVRHAARKKIANLWLRKVGVKGSSKRQQREYEYTATSEDDEVDDDGEEEAEGGEYEYYDEDEDDDAPPTVRRRRRDDDEEFQIEDDGDDSDLSFYQDEEDTDNSSSFPTDSEDDGSLVDYDSSSSSNFDTPPLRQRVASLTVSGGGFSPTTFSRSLSSSLSFPSGSPSSHFRSLSFSSTSSGASSPPSSPSSPSLPRIPRMARAQQPNPPSHLSLSLSTGSFTPPKPVPHPLSGSQGMTRPQQSTGSSFVSSLSPAAPSTAPANILPPASAPIPLPTPVPVKQEPTEVFTPTEQVDWSYLMLRPSPPPGAGLPDLSGKYLTSLLLGSAYYPSPAPQQNAISTFGTGPYFNTNLHPHTPATAPHPPQYPGIESVHGFSGGNEAFGDLPKIPHMDELAFDTNVFLS